MATTLVAAIAVAYVLLLIVLRLAESRLLYVPGARRLDPPPPDLAPERVHIPSTDGVTLVAWIIRRGAAGLRGSLAAHLSRQRGQPLQCRAPGPLRRAPRPRAQPPRLRLPGLRRERRRADRAGRNADAVAAYRYLRDVRHVPPHRIVLLVTRRLGGGGGTSRRGSRPPDWCSMAPSRPSWGGLRRLPLRAGALDRPEPLCRPSRRYRNASGCPSSSCMPKPTRWCPLRPWPAPVRGGDRAQDVRGVAGRPRRRIRRGLRGLFRRDPRVSAQSPCRRQGDGSPQTASP